MTGVGDLSKLCINHALLLTAMLVMCRLGEVESIGRRSTHPLEISLSNARHHKESPSTLSRGGSDDRPLESSNNDSSSMPRRKFLRKNRGKLSIDFGKPKDQDPSPTDDDTISLAKLLPWTASKAPLTNKTAEVSVKEDLKHDCDAEVKVSMDAFALLRLARHLGAATQVAFAAGSATLKMLGPMVMVQQVFERLMSCRKGYIEYKDEPKAIEMNTESAKKYENAIEGARTVGRVLVRFCGMYVFGILFAEVLSASPCVMPEQLCKYWYGLVWTVGVKFVAHFNELVFTHYFGLFEMRPEKHYFPLLPPTRLFQIPSLTVRWMYLFFGVVDNVLKVYSDEEAMSGQVIGPLFPSTWPPLQVLNIVAMVHAMKQSLPDTPKNVWIGFCLQIALYEEWFRVFLEERRAALGAIMGLASLLATSYFIFVTAAIDRVAVGLLLPFGLASVIATWMNFVLCGREFAPTKRPKRHLD